MLTKILASVDEIIFGVEEWERKIDYMKIIKQMFNLFNVTIAMQWALCPFCVQVPCGHAEEYIYLASSWSLMRAKVGKEVLVWKTSF